VTNRPALWSRTPHLRRSASRPTTVSSLRPGTRGPNRADRRRAYVLPLTERSAKRPWANRTLRNPVQWRGFRVPVAELRSASRRGRRIRGTLPPTAADEFLPRLEEEVGLRQSGRVREHENPTNTTAGRSRPRNGLAGAHLALSRGGETKKGGVWARRGAITAPGWPGRPEMLGSLPVGPSACRRETIFPDEERRSMPGSFRGESTSRATITTRPPDLLSRGPPRVRRARHTSRSTSTNHKQVIAVAGNPGRLRLPRAGSSPLGRCWCLLSGCGSRRAPVGALTVAPGRMPAPRVLRAVRCTCFPSAERASPFHGVPGQGWRPRLNRLHRENFFADGGRDPLRLYRAHLPGAARRSLAAPFVKVSEGAISGRPVRLLLRTTPQSLAGGSGVKKEKTGPAGSARAWRETLAGNRVGICVSGGEIG